MDRVFANGPVIRGYISGRIMPKTQKTLLDTSLLSSQHYKVQIKSKFSRESSSVLSYTSVQ